ncbi:hypothetical protein RRF57_004818 [Xylaria bambusicola]|uniref:Uncharacterized protein n=1 Tax=Xylaria bambusicola TaxID=326684 RepID=A0AAN7UKL6_9PEZI
MAPPDAPPPALCWGLWPITCRHTYDAALQADESGICSREANWKNQVLTAQTKELACSYTVS